MKGETKNRQKTDIREYAEEMEVAVCERIMDDEGNTKLVIDALNEGGYNGTHVDLLDVLEWVKANKPELIEGKDAGHQDKP